MELQKIHKQVSSAMTLIEEIPVGAWPLIDDDLTRAFNALDDCLGSLNSAVDWSNELTKSNPPAS